MSSCRPIPYRRVSPPVTTCPSHSGRYAIANPRVCPCIGMVRSPKATLSLITAVERLPQSFWAPNAQGVWGGIEGGIEGGSGQGAYLRWGSVSDCSSALWFGVQLARLSHEHSVVQSR